MSVMMRAVRRGTSRQGRDRASPEYDCARSNNSGQLVNQHCVPFGYGRWWLVELIRKSFRSDYGRESRTVRADSFGRSAREAATPRAGVGARRQCPTRSACRSAWRRTAFRCRQRVIRCRTAWVLQLNTGCPARSLQRGSARRSTRLLVALARRPPLGVLQHRTSSLRGLQGSVFGGTIRASKQLDGAGERSALFDARGPSGSSPVGLTHRTDA
jgi:hypothetical protein